MTDVKGKWALITGANRGLGFLCAKELAKRGCNLILHGRSEEKLKTLTNEISKYDIKIKCVTAELSDVDSVSEMLSNIDINVELVLNNAGMQIAYRTDPFKTPAADYTDSYVINTVAPMMICYKLMPEMIKNGFGRIVNVTSGIDKEPEQAGYSASKAALDKVTADLGTKVEGTDVMINLVDPGWCRTDLGGPKAPNEPESAVTGILLGLFLDDKKSGRIIRAQDFAGKTIEDALKSFQ